MPYPHFFLILFLLSIGLPAMGSGSELVSGVDFFCLRDEEGVKCWGEGTKQWLPGAVRFENPYVRLYCPVDSQLWKSEKNCLDEIRRKPHSSHLCDAIRQARAQAGDLCRDGKNARYIVLDFPTRVWAGGGNACATDRQGLHCWGRDPEVALVPSLESIDEVYPGDGFACAVSSRRVTCWGKPGEYGSAHLGITSFEQGKGWSGPFAKALNAISGEALRVAPSSYGIGFFGDSDASSPLMFEYKLGPHGGYFEPSPPWERSSRGRVRLASIDGASQCRVYESASRSDPRLDCEWKPDFSGDWIRAKSNLTRFQGFRQIVTLDNRYVCVVDDKGLSCHGIPDYRQRWSDPLVPEYIAGFENARSVVVARQMNCHFGSSPCRSEFCAFVGNIVRCGELGTHSRYAALLEKGIGIVQYGFTIERLENDLVLLATSAYHNDAELFRSLAKALRQVPVSGDVTTSEGRARLFALKALRPLIESLSSEHAETRVRRGFARRLAVYAQTANTSSAELAHEPFAITLGKQFLVAGVLRLKSVLPESLSNEWLNGLGQALTDEDTRRLAVRILAERGALVSIHGSSRDAAAAAFVLGVAEAIGR